MKREKTIVHYVRHHTAGICVNVGEVQCDAAEESGTAKTETAGAIALSSTVSLQIPLGDISEITSMFRQSII